MENKIDLFTPVHKGIRALIYATATRIQIVNFLSVDEGDKMLTDLIDMLLLLEDHAHHEDHIIFPRIEARAPGLSGALEAQHREGESKLDALMTVIIEMKGGDVDQRMALSTQLGRRFNDFIAFYLWHMNCEEETILPASQELLTHEELLSIRSEIQVSIPPDLYRRWLRWMLPAFNFSELSLFYKQVKRNAPDEVLKMIEKTGDQYIDPALWLQVRN